MITANEAIKIATEWNDKFDTYQEYGDAYEFYIDNDESLVGNPNVQIFSKEDGKIIPWALFFLTGDYDANKVGEPVKFKTV